VFQRNGTYFTRIIISEALTRENKEINDNTSKGS
jgi:hypothetical protein